jgi:hypothetical protein
LPVEGIGLKRDSIPERDPRIMRYELTANEPAP